MKLSEYLLGHIKEMHIDESSNLVLNCPNEGSKTMAQLITDEHWNLAGNDIYYNDGKVGIGTNTFPEDENLHVYKDFVGTTKMKVDNPNTGNASANIQIKVDSCGVNLRAFGSGSGQAPNGIWLDAFNNTAPLTIKSHSDILFRTNINTEAMRIDSTGEVIMNYGISLNNQTTIDTSPSSIGFTNTVPGSAYYPFFRTADSDRTDDLKMILSGWYQDDDNLEFLFFGWDEAEQQYEIRSNALGSGTVRNLSIFTLGNDHQLFLKTDGNVGIGTDTPNAKLNVESASGALTAGYGCTATALGAVAFGYQTDATGMYSTSMGAETTASSQASVAMGFQTIASGMYSVAMGREIEAGNNYVVAIGLDDMNGLVCSQANSMCIMGGKVGIDTASPEEKLDVRGSVIAKEGFATKLWDVAGGHFETAITGVEYYSPNQHGRIYGTIYRQYHGVKTNGQTLTTTGIERLIDFGGMMNGDMTYRGHTHSGSEYIWVHREINSVQFNVSGWNIDDGWVDYTKS